MAHESDESLIRRTRNTARFFTENRHVAWVVLVAVLLWGVYGYMKMPKRKDPEIPIRVGAVVCTWPGRSAADIEQSVTRVIEQKVAENGNIEKLFSTVRSSVSVTLIVLQPSITDVGKELDDIKGKLDQIHELPAEAGPIQFLKDFRDTTALMLTVASPVVDEVELSIRADSLRRAMADLRAGTSGPRATFVLSFPHSLDPGALARVVRGFPEYLDAQASGSHGNPSQQPGASGGGPGARRAPGRATRLPGRGCRLRRHRRRAAGPVRGEGPVAAAELGREARAFHPDSRCCGCESAPRLDAVGHAQGAVAATDQEPRRAG